MLVFPHGCLGVLVLSIHFVLVPIAGRAVDSALARFKAFSKGRICIDSGLLKMFTTDSLPEFTSMSSDMYLFNIVSFHDQLCEVHSMCLCLRLSSRMYL